MDQPSQDGMFAALKQLCSLGAIDLVSVVQCYFCEWLRFDPVRWAFI
jgi:hypothetical protein